MENKTSSYKLPNGKSYDDVLLENIKNTSDIEYKIGDNNIFKKATLFYESKKHLLFNTIGSKTPIILNKRTPGLIYNKIYTSKNLEFIDKL